MEPSLTDSSASGRYDTDCEDSDSDLEFPVHSPAARESYKYNEHGCMTHTEWKLGLTSVQRSVYLYSRFALMKMRRGMAGIRNGRHITHTFDIFVASEWHQYIQESQQNVADTPLSVQLEKSQQVVHNIDSYMAESSVVFEMFELGPSFQTKGSGHFENTQRPLQLLPQARVGPRKEKHDIDSFISTYVSLEGMSVSGIPEIADLVQKAFLIRVKSLLAAIVDMKKMRTDMYMHIPRILAIEHCHLHTEKEDKRRDADIQKLPEQQGLECIEPKGPPEPANIAKAKQVIGKKKSRRQLTNFVESRMEKRMTMRRLKADRVCLPPIPSSLGKSYLKENFSLQAAIVPSGGVIARGGLDSLSYDFSNRISLADAVRCLIEEGKCSSSETLWRALELSDAFRVL